MGVLLVAGAARFVGSGLLPAMASLNGDFSVVFPTRFFAQLRSDFPVNPGWHGWEYGPMLHFLTLPLFLVPRWDWVPAAWALVNCAAIVASFQCVRRLASPDAIPWRLTIGLVAMWLLYQPLANCLSQGNIELVEMAILLGALVVLPRWKGAVSGSLIGVAAMIKFLPVGFLLWLLVRRGYRAVVSGVVTIAVIAVVTTVTLGWKDAAIFGQMEGAVEAPLAGLHNLSVTSMFLHRTSVLLQDTTPDGVPANPVPTWLPSARADRAAQAGALVSVLLAIGFALVLFARRQRPATPSQLAVLFMTMFMILPWNDDHYYVFALLPITVLVVDGVRRGDLKLLAVVFAGYILISPPLPFSWIDRVVSYRVSTYHLYNYFNLPVAGALLVWVAATWRMFAEDRSDTVPSRRWATRGAGVAIVVAAAAAVAAVAVPSRQDAPTPVRAQSLLLEPAADLSGPPALAVSPDGRYLAYVSRRGNVPMLCLRAVERGTTTCLPGTDEAAGPFFSPDSSWVGFFAGRLLKKVAIEGHSVEVISESRGGRVGHWERDGTILLATPTNGIMRVPESGGTMDVVVPLLEGDGQYSWPSLLPSGETVLFRVAPPGGGFGAGWVTAFSLRTGHRTHLFPGSQPRFDAATGYLTFAQGGRILTVAFDPITLTASGPALPLLGNVLVTPSGGPQVALGGQGTLVYAPGSLRPIVRRQFVWVDRAGNAQPLPIPANAHQTPRLSRDGRTLVAGIRGVITDLWAHDLSTGVPQRVTFTAATNDGPVWTPEGGIAFSVPTRSGTHSAVFVAPQGGTELDASRLWEGEGPVLLGDWSASGQMIAGTRLGDLWILDPNGIAGATAARDRLRAIVAQTTAVEAGPVWSPDGQWLAYSSTESGRSEIYVQQGLGFGGRRRVSTSGGAEPVWSRDGRELFYRNDDAMMAVWFDGRSPRPTGPPRVLFTGDYVADDGVTSYDVAPDGRFLMLRPEQGVPSSTSSLFMVPSVLGPQIR